MPFDGAPLTFGDIVLVPFPFTDQSRTKRRPAVVISIAAYHARHDDVILMPVTSQMRADLRPDDLAIDDWKQSGLLKPSAVKPVIATLDKALVLRRLGTLPDQDRKALRATLSSLIG